MRRIQKFGITTAVISGFASIMAMGNPVQAEALTIGASHTLKPAFQEIVPMFEREYGVTAQVSYGPSQTLRREIEQGASIDVFLPDSIEEVEKLDKKGLTLNGRYGIYAKSSLVLVMSAASVATPISFHDALPNRAARIAVGDPKTSALGHITARALTKPNPVYRSGSNLLYGEHSDEIMDLVETGKADVGIVYRADAIGRGRMRIIDETPSGKHTSVQFGGAVVWTCPEESRDIAEEFLDFMMSPRIQKLLLKYGFDPVPSNS